MPRVLAVLFESGEKGRNLFFGSGQGAVTRKEEADVADGFTGQPVHDGRIRPRHIRRHRGQFARKGPGKRFQALFICIPDDDLDQAGIRRIEEQPAFGEQGRRIAAVLEAGEDRVVRFAGLDQQKALFAATAGAAAELLEELPGALVRPEILLKSNPFVTI